MVFSGKESKMKISRFFVIILLAGTVFNGLPAQSIAQKKPEIQPDTGFRPTDFYETNGEIFEDSKIEDLLALMDNLILQPEVQENFAKESRIHFWRLMNRLGKGVMSAPQVDRVIDYISGLRQQHSGAADMLDRQMFMINHLMIGREAPNITGKDPYGARMELTDYRGKVTLLVFSGDWCGPCRGEYPFQRFMLEYFKDEPFDIVSVNSDPLKVAKVYKKENGLNYRSFWDGPTTKGPIATKWSVTGWPTIYILDHKGIIRAKGVRQEKIITVARKLIYEMKREVRN